MENKAHALAAGLFLLVMALALAAVAAWFQGDRVERVRYIVVARQGVPGLNLKAPVKLRGVEVGKVETIGFDPADAQQILVTIAVDRAAPVMVGAYAQLGLQGVTGLSFVGLENASEAAAGSRAAEGSRIALRPTLLDRLAADGSGLLASVTETAGRLNTLLSDGNRAQLSRAAIQLADTASAAARLLNALEPAARGLPKLEKDADAALVKAGSTLTQVEALAVDARLLAQELRQRAAVLDRMAPLAAQIESSTRRLELALVGDGPPRARPLVDELAAAGRSVQRTAGDLGEQPHSLLFGRSAVLPGPGESGFPDRLKGAP
jgi:phospholipid/cholesterol/gamma-HCH transport system substrate-binding protein